MIGSGEGSAVRYEIVAGAYRDLEQASGRLALAGRLAVLLAATPDGLLPLARRQNPRRRHHHAGTDRAVPHRPAHTRKHLRPAGIGCEGEAGVPV
jgi:hypothetical protein